MAFRSYQLLSLYSSYYKQDARLILGLHSFDFFAHNCTYIKFDHCILHNLDFLGNVLKMFELKAEKMLTLGNMTVQYNRFWTGSECRFMFHLYFICPFYFLCTFWYTILLFYNWTVIKCLFCIHVFVTDITIPHFSCVSFSDGMSPNCSTVPTAPI